jgi:hypothetical protein
MEMRGYRNCQEVQRKIKKQKYAMIFKKNLSDFRAIFDLSPLLIA